MTLKFLLDENVDRVYKTQLLQRLPVTVVADLSIGRNLNELTLIAQASFDHEYQDRIEYLLLM